MNDSAPASARSAGHGPAGALRGVASLQRLVAEMAERIDDLANELAALGAVQSRTPASLITADEAAEQLGISRSRVFALIKSGALRSVKLGASRRIPRTAVDELVIALANCQRAA